MIYSEKYDIVAFALLREMFGLEFPRIAVITHGGLNYITTKDFPCRDIQISDFTPSTSQNFMFRYQLCLIIYFCKFVGADLRLPDIKVMNGVPYVWKIRSLGNIRAETISETEFCQLFETDNLFAKQIFVEEDEIPDEKLGIYNQFDAKTTFNGMKTDSSFIDEAYRDQFESAYKAEMEQFYGKEEASVKLTEIKKKSKETMLDLVVRYFREVDFDMDTIRECIYLREGAVRSTRGNRSKFPLARGQKQVEKLLTQNHAILRGPFPYRIFRMRSGQ
jgi:hypothetical protein